MKSIIKHLKSLGFVLSFFLFLFLVNPFDLNMYFGYPIVAIILLKKQFLLRNLGKDFWLLLFASVIYALFFALEPISGVQFIVVYAFFPPCFYLLGKYVYDKFSGNTTSLFYFLIIMGFLYSSTPLISVLLNILEGGFGQIDRSLPLFWDGRKVTATIMGSYYTLNMCIPALLVMKQKKSSVIFKIASIIIFILSMACTLRIGSRTQIAVFLIVLLLSLLFIIPRQSAKRNLITFILFGVALALISTKVSFDLNQDVFSTFASRMEKGGGDDIASGGGRMIRWEKSIMNIFKKPLGWETEEFGHSHNLWLDVLRVSGIIPFFLYLVFSIRSFFITKKAILMNKENLGFNNQILVYFVAMNLVFMVEPIFEGVIEMFAIFCLLMGMVIKYCQMSQEKHNTF